MRKRPRTRIGWAGNCRPKSNFTARRTARRARKRNEPIRGEKKLPTRISEILTSRNGKRRRAERILRAPARLAFTLWSATAGNGLEQFLLHIRDLRRCRFIPVIRQTF